MNKGPTTPEPGTVLRSAARPSIYTYVHMREYSRPFCSGELIFVCQVVQQGTLLCKCVLADGMVGSFWYDASEWEKVEQ